MCSHGHLTQHYLHDDSVHKYMQSDGESDIEDAKVTMGDKDKNRQAFRLAGKTKTQEENNQDIKKLKNDKKDVKEVIRNNKMSIEEIVKITNESSA